MAALADSPLDLASILGRLGRDELRSACRAHGLDATGRGRLDLMGRLAGPGGDTHARDGELRTPEVARKWGFRMNMGMDSFESMFAKGAM